MIPFSQRFHGHGGFNYLFKKGLTVRSDGYLIRYIHNPRRKTGRYSVVVSKKVSKKATVRNQLRRRVYEIVRLWLKNQPNNFDIVFFVNHLNLLDEPFTQLQSRIEADLNKIIQPNS